MDLPIIKRNGSTIAVTLILASLFLASAPAWAFHINDHLAITRLAATQVLRCRPDAKARLTGDALKQILNADMDEDLNLIRKWLHYSHYYNPFKTLDMYRADSSATIEEVESALGSATQADGDANLWAGRAIHHIQDASVPAHVEPVEHGLDDGFEALDVSLDPGFQISCTDLQAHPPATLLDLLRETAIQTDAALDAKIEYTDARARHTGRKAPALTLSWREGFWSPSNGHGFGKYGAFGNGFGQTSLEYDDSQGNPIMVTVAPATYSRFKSQQLARAVSSTAQALIWYINRVTR